MDICNALMAARYTLNDLEPTLGALNAMYLNINCSVNGNGDRLCWLQKEMKPCCMDLYTFEVLSLYPPIIKWCTFWSNSVTA